MLIQPNFKDKDANFGFPLIKPIRLIDWDLLPRFLKID